MSDKNLNSSNLVRKNSASKRNITSNQLNETVTSFQTTLKGSTSSVGALESQFMQIELNLAYTDYLNDLLKQEVVENQIKEKETILKGQILLQEENLGKKKEVLAKIQNDIEQLKKKEEIVKMINNLEENINKIKRLHGNPQMQKNIESVHNALKDKSGTLVLKNIKPLDTNEEQQKLVHSIKKLASATDKIVKCGRDFTGIHKLAEDCIHLLHIIKNIQETQTLITTIEEHAGMTVLQKLSDQFAKQYE